VFSRFFIQPAHLRLGAGDHHRARRQHRAVHVARAQYPDITPPTVEVSGLSRRERPGRCRTQSAAPIEQQVTASKAYVQSSQCTNDGNYKRSVTFKIRAPTQYLPGLVEKASPWPSRSCPWSSVRGISVKTSPNVSHDRHLVSTEGAARSNLALSKYKRHHQIAMNCRACPGVGEYYPAAATRFSMRLWLDPQKMALQPQCPGHHHAVQAHEHSGVRPA